MSQKQMTVPTDMSLQRTAPGLDAELGSLGARPIIVALIVMSVSACSHRGLHSGVEPRLSQDFLIPPGAQNVKSAVRLGYERVTYTLERAYPARDVIRSAAQHLATRGWVPLENNWFNRDEVSQFVRGWALVTGVDKPGGEERFICRWWAQWRNKRGEMFDFALEYLSPGRPWTNRSHLFVSASKMSDVIARRIPLGTARDTNLRDLPPTTPPNVETSSDPSDITALPGGPNGG